MSHHLDSPIARQDVRLDITDLYVFRGETGTVFVINLCHSIAGTFRSRAIIRKGMYEFKIDLNGDAVEDITYRLPLTNAIMRGKQRFVLRRIAGAEAADPNAAGTSSRRAPPARPSPQRTACGSGPARRAIRSGSSPTCCTRSATRSRTAPPSICPVESSEGEESVCRPYGVLDRAGSARRGPARGRRRIAAALACGLSRRSPPMPADGVRSTASAFR